MISALICFLLLASAWAMIIIPHGPPEEPMPMDPFAPLHFMLGLHKNPHIDELPVPFGIHGHVPPHDDDEHSGDVEELNSHHFPNSDQKLPPYHSDVPRKEPKVDNTKQSAQVINNYLIFAKKIRKLFGVKNGALPWGPPAESTKREKFEHGKEPKLLEEVIPYELHSPPIIRKVEHSEHPDFLIPLSQSLGSLIGKIFELGGGPGATGPATPAIEEFPKQTKFGKDGKEPKLPGGLLPQQLSNLPPIMEKVEDPELHDFLLGFMQGLETVLKIFELLGGPGATGTASPIIEKFPKQEKFVKNGKEPKLPGGLFPQQLPNLPPIVEKILPDFLMPLIKSLGQPSSSKIFELGGGLKTGTAGPVIEDKEESSEEDQPPVDQSSVTETHMETISPPELVNQQSSTVVPQTP